MKTAEDIATLVHSGREQEACLLVRQSPLLYGKLPMPLRDNERLALAAISRMPSGLSDATPRLKADIDFFIKVFSAYDGHPLAFLSLQDLLFTLEFVKGHHGYRHDISGQQAAAWMPGSAIGPHSAARAQSLCMLVHSPDTWLSTDRASSIDALRRQAPGFSDGSYEQAYTWAYSLQSSRRGEWRF